MLRLMPPTSRPESASTTIAEAPARAFFADAVARLAGVASSGRSTGLFLDQIAAVQSSGHLVDLRRQPWTDDRFGLLGLACASALELVVDGQLALAEWLAAQVLAVDPGVGAAHEVRALVAVECHRPVHARKHYAKSVGAHPGGPRVRNWLRRQQARMATRSVFLELADDVVAPDGDAVQLWQAALASADLDHRAQLQALAVVEASRPGSGYDAALWQRRYLLERLADPVEVASVRDRLDAETLALMAETDGLESSAEARLVRPAAPRPHGGGQDTTAVVCYLAGAAAEQDLAAALAEAADALTASERHADLIVVHCGLDPATVAACVESAPRVRFLAGDVRRWMALRVAEPVARRLMALDALGLAGYARVVLVPATTGIGAPLIAALAAERARAVPPQALRDDVVGRTNLVVVDADLTGPRFGTALDVAVAKQYAPGRSHDADPAWRALPVVRDAPVRDGALPRRSGFTAYHVPVPRDAEPGDDAELVARGDALVAQADNRGAADLYAREVHRPYQLTDRVLLRWAAALHGCSRYERALHLLEVCSDRNRSNVAAAKIAWVLHDAARGTAYVRALQQRRPDHPRLAGLTAKFEVPEPLLPRTGTALVHVAVHVLTGGNFGDRVLPVALRKAVSSASADPITFVPVHAHQVFDDERRELANGSAGVIVGGGALLGPGAAPNGHSGWQWNVPTEQLRRIDVPLAVLAVDGAVVRDNSHSGNLFARNLAYLVDRADVIGLRNHASLHQLRDLLPQHLAGKIEYLPCPTAVLAHLDPALAVPVVRKRSVLINASYDHGELGFGSDYGVFLEQLAGYVAALQRDEVTVRVVSHLSADEQLAADLYTEHGINLSVLKLNLLSLEEAYGVYREAGLVVGMRSRATTIPFGLRTPVLGLVPSGRTSHFLDEIAHPHWGFRVDSEFEHALLERTHDALARPADYVDAIVAAQRSLFDAVQGPLRRFLAEQVGTA